MKRILITGAAGFIGSQLTHRLWKDGVNVVLVDNYSYGSDDNLIFDDLDIDFKESDKQSIDSVTNVIRVAKDYNIDFFGKNNLKAKIIQPQHPVFFFSTTLKSFFSRYYFTFGSASLYYAQIYYIFLQSWKIAGPLAFLSLKSLVSK